MNNSKHKQNLESILDHKGWVFGDDSLSWQRDWLNKFGIEPLGVARPISTEKVCDIVNYCRLNNIHIVMQGGNTGLVGGSVVNSSNGIILSLDRMNKIISIDDSSQCISVEAGVILDQLHKKLENTDLIFPMHLGSEGSAQIGGLIATNAGGSHAFRYGMMQDLVLGLEVVLANGKLWNGMRAVQKDNAGYQLRKLFCGSEGTLGIVTKSILKLSAKSKYCCTALLAVKDSLGLMDLSKKLRSEMGELLTGMEFFSNEGLEIALENIPELVYPLQNRGSYYLLIEICTSSAQVPLESMLLAVSSWSIETKIAVDGSIAYSESQRKNFWRLREEQPEGQRRLGAQLKHDISVPLGKIAEFLHQADDECNKLIPGVRINQFGHLGDGNIHYNLSPPKGKKDFSKKQEEETYNLLAELASKMSGSFAAEHGIGRTKIAMADRLRDSSERSMMRSIKKSFDETNLLNPGVLFNDK